jgi:hypothetical protein
MAFRGGASTFVGFLAYSSMWGIFFGVASESFNLTFSTKSKFSIIVNGGVHLW